MVVEGSEVDADFGLLLGQYVGIPVDARAPEVGVAGARVDGTLPPRRRASMLTLAGLSTR